MKKILLYWLCLSSPASLHAQFNDNFDDGNDSGWTRLEPLKPHGGTTAFTFPAGNSYRMTSGASPAPAVLGQSRVGSYRPDTGSSSFRISVDLIDADAALEQDLGILARISSPGLGTLNGYSATFDTDEGRVYLSRIESEEATTIANVELPFDSEVDYRLIFHGFQNQFLVEVFDVADLSTPLVSLSGIDDEFSEVYEQGAAGLFASAGLPTGTCDVTYDNFSASSLSDIDSDGMVDDEEFAAFGSLAEDGASDFDHDGQSNLAELAAGSDPGKASSFFKVTGVSVGVEATTLNFPVAAGRTYSVERSPDLKAWVPDPSAEFTDKGDGTGNFKIDGSNETGFVRVIVTR